MRILIVALTVLLAGCGGSPTSPSPTLRPIPSPAPAPTPAPTPAPAPAPLTFTGTVTDTVTGAPVAGYSAILVGSRVTVSAPGYLTRETQNGPRVDLIRDAAPFDLAFYRQLARNAINAPSNLEGLRVLQQAPSVYLQTAGLSAATVRAFDDAIRNTVYEMSGRSFGVVALEHGDTARAPSNGWIVVELVNDDLACGRALVGSAAGHVWLNTAARCPVTQYGAAALAHEVGHALGFFHVSDPNALMFYFSTVTMPSDRERYHAAIAYKRPVGNRDVDVDAPSAAGLSAPRIVID